MIGLGLVVVEKFFRRRRRRRRRRRHLGVDPKKLGVYIKNIEYRHFSSRGCLLGKKAEGLLKTLARFSKNERSLFRGKKSRRLTKDAGQVFKK